VRGYLAELLDLVVGQGGGDERRPDGTGGDGVDPNSLVHEVLGEGVSEGGDRALGRGVVQHHRIALGVLHRCGVDDASALLQVLQRTPSREKEDLG
jgi:hypothetical protein